MSIIESIEQLEALYGFPGETSTVKVTNKLTQDYRRMIEASPFLALATCGPEGLDCSPRGDRHQVITILDDHTLHLPDRMGNNRTDSLRNIVRDPRVALLFLLPGCGNTLRVNGNAHISVDAKLLESHRVEGKAPRSVIVIQIDEVYFQCARAIVRADLWNPEHYLDASTLPSAGEILANLSEQRVGGASYDSEWPERAKRTLW
jgi:uncharacterized protein